MRRGQALLLSRFLLINSVLDFFHELRPISLTHVNNHQAALFSPRHIAQQLTYSINVILGAIVDFGLSKNSPSNTQAIGLDRKISMAV